MTEAITAGREVRRFPVDRIVMHENSRTVIDREELDDLKGSILETRGPKQPPVGYLDGPVGEGDHDVILIMGEQRLRASQELAEEGYEDHANLEVILEPGTPSRWDFLKWNLVENLHRSALRPSDIGARFEMMLEEVDEVTGQPHWSRRTLAEEVGVDVRYVTMCLTLAAAPERVRKAVDSGVSSIRVGSMIGGLPTSMQERAADELVFGPAGALSEKAARAVVAEKYRRDLRQADFDREDEGLVDRSGDGASACLPACVSCPWWGGNREDISGKAAETTCLDPVCFDRKQRAWVAQRSEESRAVEADVAKIDAPAEGKPGHVEKVVPPVGLPVREDRMKVLSAEEADLLISPATGELDPASGMVDLAHKPDAVLLVNGERSQGACPSWRKILEGQEPQVSLMFDPADGRRRELVALSVALAGGVRSKWASFFKESVTEGYESPVERQVRRSVESAGNRAGMEVRIDGLTALAKDLLPEVGVDSLRETCLMALELEAQREDMAMLVRVLGPAFSRDGSVPGSTPEEVREFLKELDADELQVVLVLILQVRRVRLAGWDDWVEEGAPMDALCKLANWSAREWGSVYRRKVKEGREAEERRVAEQTGSGGGSNPVESA